MFKRFSVSFGGHVVQHSGIIVWAILVEGLQRNSCVKLS